MTGASSSVRPIVSGVGLATAYGLGAAPCLDALFAGQRPVPGPGSAPSAAAEPVDRVPGPDLDALVPTLPAQPLRGLNAETLLAQGVCRMALADAGFDLDLVESSRLGVVVATQHAGLQDYAEQYLAGAVEQGGRVSPTRAPQTGFNAPAGYLSIRLGNVGPNATFLNGAVGGIDALLYAAEALAADRADAVLVCGVDLLPPVIGSLMDWERMPEHGRPFDGCRQGAAYGNLAAALLLERADSRHEAQGPSLGGTATAFSPAGCLSRAAKAALMGALEAGEVEPDRVAACIAGANGSLGGDLAEAAALSSVIRPDLPTCAVKGALGECFSAGAVAQAVLGVLCLERRELPPTVGFSVPDPAFSLEVTTAPRAIDPGPLLVHAWDEDCAAGAALIMAEEESG